MNTWPLQNQPTTTIPFTLRGSLGEVSIWYETNTDPIKAGFDALSNFKLDLAQTRGFPLIHAAITHYEGTGYRTFCGWIQIVTDDWYAAVDDAAQPVKHAVSVDTIPAFAALDFPFASMGTLPQLFDAPCKNINQYTKLKWIADTFLTTVPMRSRQEAITCLLGFRWGYIEYADHCQQPVEVFPLQITDGTMWMHHLPYLTRTFPNWRFQGVET